MNRETRIKVLKYLMGLGQRKCLGEKFCKVVEKQLLEVYGVAE